jgi:AraC-like DNA-binding protein
MPWWDFPRTAGAVRALVAAGEARGLSRERGLAASGITPAALDDPELLIEAAQELQVMRNLLSGVGNLPGLGAELGRRARLGSFGIWGYAVLTSPTFADATRLGVRFARLSFAFTAPVVHDRLPRIDLGVDDVPEDVRDFACERDIASILVVCATIAPGVVPQLHTHLDDERAAALAGVLPGIRIRSGEPADCLLFDAGQWTAALPQAHADTVRSCVAACGAVLESRMARRGTSARVRARLLERPDVKPTMATVAAELLMEERTLRRHLAAEGTSFSELVDEVHEMLATQLLTIPSMTVEDVARRLGYADGPTFTHAFKRWTGMAPSVWRAAQRQGA